MNLKVRGCEPVIGGGCYIAPTAVLIGDVKIGKGSSVWFQSVLRGDVHSIEIGENTNIQDLVMIHGTFEKASVKIGDRVTVGHSVVLHGCTIGDGTLVGMGSVVMDHVEIGKNCVVGAGSLVTQGLKFEDGQLILGRPAKAIRKLTSKEMEELDNSWKNYVEYTKWYRKDENGK